MDNKSEIKKPTMHENLKTKQQQQNSSSKNSWVKRKPEFKFHMEITTVIIMKTINI